VQHRVGVVGILQGLIQLGLGCGLGGLHGIAVLQPELDQLLL
jgi:hypothetical protein